MTVLWRQTQPSIGDEVRVCANTTPVLHKETMQELLSAIPAPLRAQSIDEFSPPEHLVTTRFDRKLYPRRSQVVCPLESLTATRMLHGRCAGSRPNSGSGGLPDTSGIAWVSGVGLAWMSSVL